MGLSLWSIHSTMMYNQPHTISLILVLFHHADTSSTWIIFAVKQAKAHQIQSTKIFYFTFLWSIQLQSITSAVASVMLVQLLFCSSLGILSKEFSFHTHGIICVYASTHHAKRPEMIEIMVLCNFITRSDWWRFSAWSVQFLGLVHFAARHPKKGCRELQTLPRQ